MRVPVSLWDERLTTVEAEQALIERDVSAAAAQGAGGPGGGRADPPGLPRRAAAARRPIPLPERTPFATSPPRPRSCSPLGLAACWWIETRFPVRTANAAAADADRRAGPGRPRRRASLRALGLVRHPQVFRLHVVLARRRRAAAHGRVRAPGRALDSTRSWTSWSVATWSAAWSRSRRARTSRRWSRSPPAEGLDAAAFRAAAARPVAHPRPRSRGDRPRGLPLPRHLRPHAAARGGGGAGAADGAALPRRDRSPSCRRDHGERPRPARRRDAGVGGGGGDGPRRGAAAHGRGLPQPPRRRACCCRPTRR